jgi:hypothetical protein
MAGCCISGVGGLLWFFLARPDEHRSDGATKKERKKVPQARFYPIKKRAPYMHPGPQLLLVRRPTTARGKVNKDPFRAKVLLDQDCLTLHNYWGYSKSGEQFPSSSG